MASNEFIAVEVVFSPAAREVRSVTLQVPAGTTVVTAIRQSGVLRDLTALEIDQLTLGIWGRITTPSDILRDRDRIELYRQLRVDPKVARRERFEKQGSRKPGLFAR